MADFRKGPRYLLVRPGAIGDAIVTLPAVQAIQAQGAAVELVVGQGAAALLRRRCAADAVHSYEEPRWANLFARKPPAHLGAFLQTFDAIILYLAATRMDLASRLAAALGTPVIGWPSLPDEAHPLPISDHLQQPLLELGLCPRSAAPRLTLTDKDRARANAWWADRQVSPGQEVIVALHPGSGSARKNWPLANFEAVAAHFERYGAGTLVIAGPAEAGRLDQLATWKIHRLSVAHGLNLAQIGALLTDCACFVGNDSGIAHLSAALGVPTVVLFGPTDARVWAPRGPTVRIIKSGDADEKSPMEGISVSHVAQAVASIMGVAGT